MGLDRLNLFRSGSSWVRKDVIYFCYFPIDNEGVEMDVSTRV